jgi:hypothetical protein
MTRSGVVPGLIRAEQSRQALVLPRQHGSVRSLIISFVET